MKRISIFIGSMSKGGGERVCSLIANHFSDLNFDVTIYTLLDSKVEYKLRDNVKVNFIYSGNIVILKPIRYLYNVTKILLKNNGIVLSFFARINIIVLIGSLFSLKRNRIVISERNDPNHDGRGFLVKLLTNMLYPLADRIIFQTNYAKMCFSNKIQSKGEIIANPISNIIKSSISIENRDKVILNVGRLEKQKNQQLLIEAFNVIHNKIPDYNLHIYGKGSLKSELLSLVHTLSLEDRVFINDPVDNIFEIMKKSKLLVLTSNYEGLSNVILESMVSGLPVISSNVSGIDETIIDGENGFLFKRESIKELSNLILKVIENGELLSSVVHKASILSNDYLEVNIMSNWKRAILGELGYEKPSIL
jgi:glycosyltransferase involved in cell wall biosynthesis